MAAVSSTLRAALLAAAAIALAACGGGEPSLSTPDGPPDPDKGTTIPPTAQPVESTPGSTPLDPASIPGGPALLTPLPDGEPGFGVVGPFGFIGTLSRKEPKGGDWNLDAEFRFPSAGYAVGVPTINIAESLPEKVTIRIPVTPPEPGSVNATVIEVVPVQAQFHAGDRAAISIMIDNLREVRSY